MLIVLSYLLLGAIAGTLAGLFGIGGGLIIVPALVFGFELQDVSADVATHLAVGTSLATIVATSISSVRSHNDKGAVSWPIFKPMTVGLLAGAVLGVATAASLEGAWLRFVIGLFAIAVGLQMAFALKPKPGREVPATPGLVAVGGGIGWASAIFGVGGGAMTVPFLSWCNVRMQQAVGTAAACGLPIAIAGAITNIVQGWGHPGLPGASLGYVYLPAWLGIVVLSVPFARFGARLAHKLPAQLLKRAFAVLLFIVGARFLIQAWPSLLA